MDLLKMTLSEFFIIDIGLQPISNKVEFIKNASNFTADNVAEFVPNGF